jgi:hypothetical protein
MAHVGISDVAVVKDIAQHVPAVLTMDAVGAASGGRDIVIAIVGGSAVGLATIVARELGIPSWL